MHFLAPSVLWAVKGVFHGAWGAPTRGRCVGSLPGHHENSQLSPLVFSRDPASVSSEEFNQHVVLITDLFFCKGKWAWNKLRVPQSPVWGCVCPWLPWRLWRLQQHCSHPQQCSLCLQGKSLCVHTTFKTTPCFYKALYSSGELLISCRVIKQQ